jgi:ATP-dependent RNA helicase DeaD
MTTAFATLGLCPGLVQTVTALGYTQPTPIQAKAIPELLAGRDVLGQAQTGTGKTAAFALPMLQILEMQGTGVQGLVLAPTRELAIQVAEAIYRYGHSLGARVLPIYGGQAYARQQQRLAKGVPIVVGTPGRTLDLLRQGALDLGKVRYLVLDEADAMLQMGFIEDVEALLSATPPTRQTALFSATLPSAIRHLAARYMRDPLAVAMDEARTVPQTTQRYYLLQESSKVAALTLLLEAEEIKSALIFTRTRVGAAELAETLVTRGYPA